MCFPVNIAKNIKVTYFERHMQKATSDSSSILHKKLNKIIQEPDWPFVSFWNIKLFYSTYSHSFSFVLSLAVIHCPSMSFFVTRCHSLWLFVIRYYDLSLVVIYCTTCYHSLYQLLSLVVTCCHSLSLFVPLFCYFASNR